jgi:3-phenylpropionate/trans-cinnamate dioxygenase ferredoxin reductase subunit
METTLIVGACQAGVQLAASLRDLGDTDAIVMIGEEAHRPYQRPPLSKGWLKGELEPDDVILRTRQWFDDRDIELIAGDRVVTIHRDDDGSGVAHTLGGRRIPFTRLALTTGASVRRLTLPGTDYRGVHYLRDADDAIALGPALAEPAAQRVVVIGGGFIGLEAAAAARQLGKDVTLVEGSGRLIGRVVAEPTSAFYLEAHRRRGTEVVLGARLARILGEDASAAGRRGSVTGVELDDGRVIPADLVVIGIGVLPRVELAVQLGLAVDGGIVVDDRCLASDGRTVAAGDCAIMPNPYAGGVGGMVRIESVNNALEQAKVAAATLLGQDASYSTVPWFWSDQADLKLQIAGLSAGYDAVVVRGDPDSEKFAVLYYRGGRLIAADCVNQPAEFLAIKHALAKGQTIPPEAAADTSVRLKQSIVDAPVAVAS